MKSYFCPQLGCEVGVFLSESDSSLKGWLVSFDTGLSLGNIFAPYPDRHPRCGFVDTKTFPWLGDFLFDNGVAVRTHIHLIADLHVYDEFFFF